MNVEIKYNLYDIYIYNSRFNQFTELISYDFKVNLSYNNICLKLFSTDDKYQMTFLCRFEIFIHGF